MTERMKGGQAAVRSLESQGVDVVFGIPGVHTLEIYDALVDSSIRHVLARHEQGAGFMADGYARASGRPGVAVIITGPGITNVMTAVGEAYTDSSPILILSSNVEQQWAGQMLGHLHDLSDQLGVMHAVTKWNARATNVGEIPSLVAKAFTEMNSGRPRPTHVEVPLDVLSAFDDVSFVPAVEATPAELRQSDVRQALDAIKNAGRVVIWCGGGAVSSGAGDAIAGISERLGAPIIASAMGKGSVPGDHPMMLGKSWEPGNPVDVVLRSSDLALVFGSKLGAMETEYQRMPMPAKMIRVDVDSNEITRNYTPSLPIVGDARITAQSILAGLDQERITKQGWSADEVKSIKRAFLAGTWGKDHQPYVDALRSAIPRDGILVSDMTMMGYVCQNRYPVYEPRTFLFPQGYGTLGFSLPAAIGAKVARPDKVVVPIVGDGGFQYTMQELATAVQFKLGLPIVIFNDSTYTAVKMEQASKYDRRYIAVDLVNPDYRKLADAYGIPSTTARSPEELEQAIVGASKLETPTIIDTPISFAM
jgi:thiamine pyrophosphate-dependent acetolactate synthase large subunit-like protein